MEYNTLGNLVICVYLLLIQHSKAWSVALLTKYNSCTEMSDSSSDRPARTRPHNPFSIRDRENFPNMEAFFGNTLNQTIESISSRDDGESSTLNMSIGARAAITEHLRHVLKYGLDGETQSESQETAATKNLLDQKWEHFLEQQSSVRNSSASRTGLEMISASSSCLEQSIEVMTDISHDFFNSSRVQLLATPERNRNRIHPVSTREQVHADADDDDFPLDDEAADIMAPELLVMNASSSEEHRHSSFLSSSFCAPDISRISSADDSEPGAFHRSPNTSFQFHHNLLRLDEDSHLATEDGAANPIILGPSSWPVNGLESHQHPFELSFESQPPSRCQSDEVQRRLSSQLFGTHRSFCETNPTQNLILPRRSNSAPGLAAQDTFNKENQLPRNPFAMKFSTSQTRRQLHKDEESSSSSKRLSPTEPAVSALDTLPMNLMEAIELARVEEGGALSPISKVGSSHVGIFYESSSSSSRRRRLTQELPVVGYPPVASMPARDASTSTSSSSLTGRKRFRTVVPRRVYMDSPSQFPDEQDSFGHSSPDCTIERPAQRSLLDSFEGVADEFPTSGCSACYTY